MRCPTTVQRETYFCNRNDHCSWTTRRSLHYRQRWWGSVLWCHRTEAPTSPHAIDGINPQSVVVLDNCSIHHTRRATELIQSTGALVHFFPPLLTRLIARRGIVLESQGLPQRKRSIYWAIRWQDTIGPCVCSIQCCYIWWLPQLVCRLWVHLIIVSLYMYRP